MSDIGSDKYRERKARKKQEIVLLSDLELAELQAFADFQYKELKRHEGDCVRILSDLEIIAGKYGVLPKPRFVDKWIECRTGNGLK